MKVSLAELVILVAATALVAPDAARAQAATPHRHIRARSPHPPLAITRPGTLFR
jgi:hypothetical protein